MRFHRSVHLLRPVHLQKKGISPTLVVFYHYENNYSSNFLHQEGNCRNMLHIIIQLNK